MQSETLGARCGLATAAVVVMSAAGSADGAIFHLTTPGGYPAQSTTGSAVAFAPFTVELWVEDFQPGETLDAAEFSLNVSDPDVLFLTADPIPGGGTLGSPTDLILVPGQPISGPTKIFVWTFIPFTTQPSDILFSLGPSSVGPNSGAPGPVWSDNNGDLRFNAYASSLLINPSGATPNPEWLPTPGTAALLGLGSIAMMRRRR